jgi:DNA-binding protein H-NS
MSDKESVMRTEGDADVPEQPRNAKLKAVRNLDLQRMSVNELWSLYELVEAELSRVISAEKAQLERRLRQLGGKSHAKRPYPKVFPKYRNPAIPSETWAGRGKRPRWVAEQLKSGKKLDQFRIGNAPTAPARRASK